MFGETNIKQQFHVVSEEINISTDAILGRDFFKTYNCKIDYETCVLIILVQEEEIVLPLNMFMKNIGKLKIPPRSEVIKSINLDLNEDNVVIGNEIKKGIFLANSIVPSKGIKHIKILNSTDKEQTIENVMIAMEPLSKYRILSNNTKFKDKRKFQKLMKSIQGDNLDTFAAQTVIKICEEFQDVFHDEDKELTTNNFYEQHITLSDKNPVYIKNYRLPNAQLDEIQNQVSELLKNDIIEESISPYNSPLLIVPKKNQTGQTKWRLVVDFRSLNKKVVDDKFPLTRLEDVLDKLGNAKYFSTLDMTSSFHQIPLNKHSRPLTAFSTNEGHYQFKRLPFGLKISTNSFQRMMSIALSGLQASAFLYVDDVIVFGKNLKNHNENLIKVLGRLRRYNLKLNLEKCNFLKTEVIYLGHLITPNGVKPDPMKYETIKNYPLPKNADDVRRFIAFCNYYRKFIKDFAEIAKPMNQLLKKKQIFSWTEDCEKSFNTLKQNLMTPPILSYPDFKKPFILTTDASNFALGAVLSQGDIGTDKPIAYASRSLNKHELNKPIIEKELLAIHWGINYFRPYLFGRKFIVYTDHRPLVSLFTHKNPSSKLTRIRVDLMDYDFEIIFKQGKMNTNADALSRIKIESDELKEMIPKYKIDVLTRAMKKNKNKILNEDKNCAKALDSNTKTSYLHIWDCTSISDIRRLKKIKFEESNVTKRKINEIIIAANTVVVEYSDKSLSEVKLILRKLIFKMNNAGVKRLALARNSLIFNEVCIQEFKEIFNKLQENINEDKCLDIILFEPPKQITDEKEMHKLIEEYHNSKTGGHCGIRRCVNKLKQRYVWKNMNKMVKKYVNNCKTCNETKITRYTKENIVITDTPSTSFETITIDTVGPLRPSNGYRYILTVQCDLTKFVEAFPIETKEANTVAKAIVEKFILKYGCFKKLKTDKGTEFTNELLKNICTLLKIEKIVSTPFHHETMGSIERNHRVFNEYIMSVGDKNNWEEWLPYYTYCYNSTPHSSTLYSPFELVFGKLCTLPCEVIENKDTIYNIDNYLNEFKCKLRHAHEQAKNNLINDKYKKQNFQKNVNRSSFIVGDYVYLKNQSKRKFDKPFRGPYKIISRNGVNSTILLDDKNYEIHNNNLIKARNTILQ